MGYLLLTGSTGLVGGYLLRYLLEKEEHVAVLVRSTRIQPAVDRVEAVMQRWERLEGRTLPRPVVLEGDLTTPQLGLDDQATRWVTEHCDRVLHNAASMTFREDPRSHEPFRTNVDGVQNMLDLCRRTGVRQFHHVSTAYVCGLRTGSVLETELDLGQENGNVYERSKLTGEKMVLEADHLQQVTVYRPASVVGDSQTGYTTSAHGFYLPLQLASTIADKVPTSLMGDRFFRLLGLSGSEGKNLVPVDWLAQAIVDLVSAPPQHGRTYHLTNPQPVTVRLIQEVIQEAVEKYSTRQFSGVLSEKEIADLEQLFGQYMDIYRSHWRDDPLFDRTHTDRALPHLPCPMVDHDMLLRIAAYPVQKNFAFYEPTPPPTGLESRPRLESLSPVSSAATGRSMNLEVSGPGGGQWRLQVHGDRLLGASPGLDDSSSCGIYLNNDTFAELIQRRRNLRQAIDTGRLIIEGAEADAATTLRALETVFQS
ncbi:MAG: NAD-dependent epimerase/dehydratase family protein [Planctomycetales bacterium]|nr:NAD-dependent epimerase/dehydratase family protein [Planctomycetales bacterium]NIM09039.1 NAD-dependent epimerase/dehydratase family protein [Planctomycetales bacterium]NIN08502.1 NAD-dependent epimerase/dehydratase family protein [Planctomycetales bacterium]NIN77636.1 NAD-dependent epimerase/dehydratase family protein [Planctomycetales bacterium]NIO34799.1 NAD-dependent epimerase/dehydratase family protein [Planctomycetales bacterium]